jgi:hypothetical protein
MLSEVKAKLMATTLTEDQVARDAQWQEVWFVSEAYKLASVRVLVGDTLEEVPDTSSMKGDPVSFVIGPYTLSPFKVLLVLWFIGESGPGLCDVGEFVTLEEEWVRHAMQAGVL